MAPALLWPCLLTMSRDFEFAQQFNLEVVAVVDPAGSTEVDPDAVLAGKQCFIGLGKAINSGPYNGMATEEVKAKITEKLSTAGIGRQGGELQAARLAVQSSTILGRTVSDSA